MNSQRQAPRVMSRRRTLALGTALIAGLLGGCEGLLDVELPGSITDRDLFHPSQAGVLVASAAADVECAVSEFIATTAAGSEDALRRTTGWWAGAHEYIVAPNTANCATSENAYGWYVPLHKGRFVAERAYEAIEGWDDLPNKNQLLARAAIYAGVTYNLLGDYFCEVSVDKGPLMNPDATLAKAEDYLTKALTHIGSGDFAVEGGVTSSAKGMAHLLRARVRFARGNNQGALEDATAVTHGYVAWITRESTGPRQRGNRVVAGNNDNAYVTVAGPIDNWTGPGWTGVIPFTGYRNLAVLPDGRAITATRHPITMSAGAGAVADVRVPVLDTGMKTNGIDFWVQRKYLSRDYDIPLANWEEAWLIRAEIVGGQGAIDLVNEIRDFHDLPSVTYLSPGDAQGIKDMIIEERRRSLFLEGRFYSTKIREDLWFPRNIGSTPVVAAPYFGAVRLVMPMNEYELTEGLDLTMRGTMCGDEQPVL